jgi:hypothetical protein
MLFDPKADQVMRVAAAPPHPAAPHIRRPWLQLLAAVMELAGKQAELLRHTDRPWASVTFTGSRHSIALAFTGDEAAAQGELFIAALPEHEFTVARQIVADAAVTSVVHLLVPEPRLTVEFELLLLEEG